MWQNRSTTSAAPSSSSFRSLPYPQKRPTGPARPTSERCTAAFPERPAPRVAAVPELPEVEVIRRRLAPQLVGRKLREVATTAPSYFFLTPPGELREKLTGKTFTHLIRYGKYLVAQLDDDCRLLLHLGMTGQLFTSNAASQRLAQQAPHAPQRAGEFIPDRHTHLRWYFSDDGPAVFFRDARKFGKVRWLAAGQSDPRLDKLGPDALAVEPDYLAAVGRRRRTPIKNLLLDQRVLAGVGNIYADEALFLTHVRPTRPSNRLSEMSYQRLVSALQRVLQLSIEAGGSSISDYVTPDGTDGGYQLGHRVYGREGQPCPVCDHPIRRIVLGQRSAHYCSRCQR